MYMFYKNLHRKIDISTYTDTHYFYIICYVHVIFFYGYYDYIFGECVKLNIPLFSLLPGKNRGEVVC